MVATHDYKLGYSLQTEYSVQIDLKIPVGSTLSLITSQDVFLPPKINCTCLSGPHRNRFLFDNILAGYRKSMANRLNNRVNNKTYFVSLCI